MGDRARAAAVRFWRAERIADLSGENAIAPRPGEAGGRFLVIERLGAGGFGSVDRAIDNATGDEVAIKRMRGDAIAGREDAAAVFASVQNEVKAAGKVSNRPYVARTRYLNIEPSGAIVLVQDFVRGPTLRTLLKEGVDRARLFSIGARLARAIAGIHATGIAHRDLKPENVILRNGSEPVLIDLGLARIGGAPDVLAGMGTPPYAAPEQWEATVDPRWSGREDIYALGVIVGELAGETEAAGAPAGAFAALRQRLSRKSTLPAKLERLRQTMLAKDPAAREVDLHAVAAALDEAAAEEAEARK
jgi:serine/threonine protein kinase